MIAVGLLVSMVLPVPTGWSAPQPVPAVRAQEKSTDSKGETRPPGVKDGDEPFNRKDSSALLPLEVLCERKQFFKREGVFASAINGEWISNEKRQLHYGLSSVTVPKGGWKVEAIAIYTAPPVNEKDWLKVNRARLNVFPKRGDLPDVNNDPRDGREVEVTVRERREDARDTLRPMRVYEVRAVGLQLTLEPGEYWIGITPIDSVSAGAPHLLVQNVHDARFDDVHQDENRSTKERDWNAVRPIPDVHLSIRIEGRRRHRGQILDLPADKEKKAKHLHLRFGTFDPVADTPKVSQELSAPEGGNVWIVQCRGSVDQTARDQLTRAGATLLRYLPDDAYIVRLAPEAVETIRRSSEVRWVGPYHPAYRVEPTLFPEEQRQALFPGPKVWRRILVHLFDRDEGTNNAVAKVIRDAGGTVEAQCHRGYYLIANVPLDRVAVVAHNDAVCAVERFFAPFGRTADPFPGNPGLKRLAPAENESITLAQIRELCGADAVKKAGGYEGLGVRVAFWETDVYAGHVDLLARPFTTVLSAKEKRDRGDHGAAVASILCGEGRADPRARGLLPLGGLVFASVDAMGADPVHVDRYRLVERFVRDHRTALLSSSSGNWSAEYNDDYQYIKHYDAFSFLLDDLVAEYDLLICSAIGNNPGSNGHSGSWAKNALIVGGVDPRHSLRREDHCHMYCSGPAPDGRVKPDLVHFCQDVFCAYTNTPRGYGNFGGTSCATPLVAGHCGLMIEMWADGAFGTLPLGQTVSDRKPHAATARALMINSAYRYPIDERKLALTRFRQGWGMPDLARLYESRKKLFVVDHEIALRDHQAVEYRLRIPENEPELRATLAYTDPLGTIAAAKTLVNDLDLIVIDPDGKRYLGNSGLLKENVSAEAGEADRVNNVENVFLLKPKAGVWRVVVAAHRIAWDGHRGTAGWDQNFALVVSGVENEIVPGRRP